MFAAGAQKAEKVGSDATAWDFAASAAQTAAGGADLAKLLAESIINSASSTVNNVGNMWRKL